MQDTTIYEHEEHSWIVFGRDPDKPEKVIDTNQYMVKVNGETVLLDPGGIELFAPMLASIVRHTPVEKIVGLFASHQDPDIISSLGLWDKVLPGVKLHAPWMWEGFIRHFGCESIIYQPIPDEGGVIEVGGEKLMLVPAHYVHSSGNFSVYDPKAKILMSGDIGAALLPHDAPFYVEDFDAHVPAMEGFHRRWMPSNAAKNAWIRRVRKLEIELMCPQHGGIFRGDDVGRFLDWFEMLDVGSAIAEGESEILKRSAA
jgi:flavorubredoxin